MKILAIFHHPPKVIGGVERRFLKIAKIWSNFCDLYVVEPYPSLNPICRCIFNIKVKGFSSHLKAWSWIRKVSKIGGDYDVVLAVDNRFTNTVPAYNLAKKLKCKLVITDQLLNFPTPFSFFKTYNNYQSQGFHVMGAFLSTIDVYLSIKKSLKADLHLAVSDYVAKGLLRIGVPHGKIIRTANGVNLDIIDAVKPARKIFDACFCGRLHPQKGIFNLIHIWKLVTKRKKDAKLVIVGTGSKEIIYKLKNEIKCLNLSKNILMTGYVNEKEKISLLKQSKLFVSTSLYEGLPITPLEAAACRLPLILSDIPPHREEFNDSAAIFVSPSDLEGFAEAIINVLVKPPKHISENARKTVEKLFTWNEIGKQELDIIRSLLMEKNK